jgi:hypothetical protein
VLLILKIVVMHNFCETQNLKHFISCTWCGQFPDLLQLAESAESFVTRFRVVSLSLRSIDVK